MVLIILLCYSTTLSSHGQTSIILHPPSMNNEEQDETGELELCSAPAGLSDQEEKSLFECVQSHMLLLFSGSGFKALTFTSQQMQGH